MTEKTDKSQNYEIVASHHSLIPTDPDVEETISEILRRIIRIEDVLDLGVSSQHTDHEDAGDKDKEKEKRGFLGRLKHLCTVIFMVPFAFLRKPYGQYKRKQPDVEGLTALLLEE